MIDLFSLYTSRLDAAAIEYLVTGSVAATVYGEPRMTHDVDLIVALDDEAVPRFVAAFDPGEFYCAPEEVIRVECRRAHRGHFNVIHHETGFKADVYIRGSDPLHRWAWPRRREIALPSGTLWVAPPEYVILRKLEFYREGGSEKHLSDIRGIMRGRDVRMDEGELARWIERLGLADAWRAVASPDPDA